MLRIAVRQGKGDVVGTASFPLRPFASVGKNPQTVKIGEGQIELEIGAELKVTKTSVFYQLNYSQ